MKAATAVAVALATGLGLTTLFSDVSHAQAQQGPKCGPSHEMEEGFFQSRAAQRSAFGMVSPDNLLEIFSNAKGEYAVVDHKATGESCMMMTGEQFTPVTEDNPFPDLKQELSPQQNRAIGLIAAQSRRRCGLPESFINNLSTRYQEVPIAAGVSADGSMMVVLDTPDGALKEDGTASDDSWTVLNIKKDERLDAYVACMGPSGQHWTPTEHDPNKEPAIRGLEVSAPAIR